MIFGIKYEILAVFDKLLPSFAVKRYDLCEFNTDFIFPSLVTGKRYFFRQVRNPKKTASFNYFIINSLHTNVMKKVVLLFAFLLVGFAGYSQELGIRFGDVLGNDVAIDGMFKAGKAQRIHANLSFGDERVGAEVLWHLLYKPLGGESFHWYVGVGPSALLGNQFKLGASGEIGLEYRFNSVPLAMGVDWRPTLFIVDETDFSSRGFGFNVRYVFGRR